MLSTVSALAAQNIGAGKYDRAKQTLRYAMMIAIGFGLVVSILIQFIAAPVVGLSLQTQPLFFSAHSTFADISGIVFLPAFISVSADTSVHAENLEFHFYIT